MHDILVTPIDNHNESTIILIKKYKFQKIVVLYEEECRTEIRENLIRVANKEGSEIEFLSYHKIKENIEEFFIKYKNPLVNLTGGERIQSLYFLRYILKNNIDGIYVDIIGRKKYIFGSNEDVVEEHLLDLEIEDLIKASGNEIIEESYDLIHKKWMLDITMAIYKNSDLWDKYKMKLYDLNVFSHYYGDTTKVIVKMDKLESEEKKLLEKIIKWGVEKQLISTTMENSELVVRFENKYLKSFIFKSGTWLEVLTEKVVSEISTVDEVKGGVVFQWKKDGTIVKNELDVVAIRDSTMVVISCKDSAKYSEVALNELLIYSERIGGKKVKKILVATKEPVKEGIHERANEMGIDIVVLDKDLDKFKNRLRDIINK